MRTLPSTACVASPLAAPGRALPGLGGPLDDPGEPGDPGESGDPGEPNDHVPVNENLDDPEYRVDTRPSGEDIQLSMAATPVSSTFAERSASWIATITLTVAPLPAGFLKPGTISAANLQKASSGVSLGRLSRGRSAFTPFASTTSSMNAMATPEQNAALLQRDRGDGRFEQMRRHIS